METNKRNIIIISIFALILAVVVAVMLVKKQHVEEPVVITEPTASIEVESDKGLDEQIEDAHNNYVPPPPEERQQQLDTLKAYENPYSMTDAERRAQLEALSN